MRRPGGGGGGAEFGGVRRAKDGQIPRRQSSSYGYDGMALFGNAPLIGTANDEGRCSQMPDMLRSAVE